MTNYVYIATSLDGFIATPDGGLDWLNDSPNPERKSITILKSKATIVLRAREQALLLQATADYERVSRFDNVKDVFA